MVSQQAESSSRADLDSSSGVWGQQEGHLANDRPHISNSAWVSDQVCSDGRTLSYIQNLSSSGCR